MQTKISQHRNFKWTYLFKEKEKAVKLTIFNLSQKKVFKCTLAKKLFKAAMQRGSPDIAQIVDLPKKYRMERLILPHKCYKKLMQHIYRLRTTIFAKDIFVCPITQTMMSCPVTVSDGHTFDKEALEKHRLNLANRNRPFLCPLDRRDIFFCKENILAMQIIDHLNKKDYSFPIRRYKEAVMDEHGRTHEKADIEKLMESKEGCIIDGRRVNTIVPNFVIQDFINSLGKEFFPQFSTLKKNSPNYAEGKIKKALEYVKQQNYKKAQNCYSKAFEYSHDWQHYADIPALFTTLKTYDKASLAYLYLTKYQLDAGNLKQAIKTLEYYKKSSFLLPLLNIDIILADLYALTDRPRQAVDLVLKFVAKKEFNRSLSPYNAILEKNSISYDKLADIVSAPNEKAHILCKGALEAFFAKRYAEAKNFLERARSYNSYSVIDRLIYWKVCQRLGLDMNSKMVTFARKLGQLRLWSAMLKTYKMVPKSTYEVIDIQNSYNAYAALGKKKMAADSLLQLLKTMGKKEWNFRAYSLTADGMKTLFENISETVEMLSIRGSRLSRFIKLPAKLRSLSLEDCGISAKDAQMLAMHFPKNLQSLNLADNAIIPKKVAEPQSSGLRYVFDKSLTFLPLYGNSEDALGAFFKKLPATLTELNLSGNSLGNSGLKALCCYLPKGLLSLNLAGCNIGFEGIKAFAHYLPKNLSVLNLKNNMLESEGALALAQYLPKSLLSLNLKNNAIGELQGSVQYLPKNLRSLNLMGNYLARKDVTAVIQQLPKTLESLNLGRGYTRDRSRASVKGVLNGLLTFLPHHTVVKDVVMDFKQLPGSLKKLDLSNNHLEPDEIKNLFQHLPKDLLSLNLDWTQIGTAGVKELALNLPPRLQKLSLRHNQIKYDGAVVLAQYLPETLLSLDLRCNQIEDIGVIALSQKLPQTLVSLDLKCCGIGDAGAKMVAWHLPKKLLSLNIGWNKIGYKGVEELARFLPSSLQELNIWYNQIGDRGVELLAKQLPPALKLLDIGYCGIGDAGAIALAKQLPSTLLSLNVHWNNIGNSGAVALAQSLPITLQALDFGSCKIQADGALELIKYLPQRVQKLDLRAAKLGCIGAKMLAKHLPSTLKILDLRDCGIGNDGAVQLSLHLPATLRSLNLSWNPIGDERIRVFLQYVPATLQVQF